jgi:V8-like Glu-specific endopeptidase
MANEPPIPIEELARRFKARLARKPAAITRTQRFFVHGGREPPEVRTRVQPIRRGKGGVDYEVVVETTGVDVRDRAKPQMMKGRGLRPEEARFDEAELQRLLDGFVPDHLDFNPKPQKRVKPFRTILSEIPRDRNVATTLFGTDDRMVFRDTNYPWSTVGLVETNRGSGSGVVIGPRHLLTVSHVIDWTAPAGFAADWVRFTPSYFDGDAPFGETYGIHVYWYLQEDGDGFISGSESDFDYVVVVLDHRIGESTGWMGARHYNDDWDSLNVWSHMGYPGDLNSGQRPIFISPFTLNGTDDDAQDMLHQADVFPGQSGGPMFAWWDGDVGPRAVAVQSYQNASNNGASGGRSLRNLVAQARTDFA